jgi:hypothetical protein
MKLAEILSKADLLKAQQDFIDTFPDGWSFKITNDGKLEASVEDDTTPMYATEDEIGLPDQSVKSAPRARAEIEADYKKRKIDVKVTGGKVVRGYLEDAQLEFPSYTAAFEYYVRDYAWNQYGNSFVADDIWARINELTAS